MLQELCFMTTSSSQGRNYYSYSYFTLIPILKLRHSDTKQNKIKKANETNKKPTQSCKAKARENAKNNLFAMWAHILSPCNIVVKHWHSKGKGI